MSTLFTLTPVSTPPEKEGWYWTEDDSLPLPRTSLFEGGKWKDIGDEDAEYFETTVSHYLRPISEEKLREVMIQVWEDCENKEQDLLSYRETSITNAIKALQNGK